jgi:hypothetical protein
MDNKIKAILTIILAILIAFSVVITLVFYYGTSLYAPDAEFSEQIDKLGWRLDTFLNWAIILGLIAAAAAIIFPLINMVTNPSNSKKSFIVLVSLIAVAVIGYLIAEDSILQFNGYESFFYAEGIEDPNQFSKNVGTGLWTMYLLFGISIVSILYYEIGKFFK